MLICKAPYCPNERYRTYSWCVFHIKERTQFKVKPYYELIPLWSAKRCKTHGLLRFDQVYINPSSKAKRCLLCKPSVKVSPEKQKAYNQKYSEYRRESRLNKRYKIGIQEYEEILKIQNFCCAICNTHHDQHKSLKNSNFAVDHCHQTNKVRGLLCYRCNLGLGYFNDNPNLLEQATNYLIIKLSE